MTAFRALPPSWTALSSLRKVKLAYPGPLDAALALQPLGSWTQLTSLHIASYLNNMECMPGSLQQQLTRLSSLQHLHMERVWGFELPPGHWQGQLTSLECHLHHMLGSSAHPSRAAAVLEHAALRRLVIFDPLDEPTPPQPQLRALLGALSALPALEFVTLPSRVQQMVLEAHTALGSPLGERLQFDGDNWL